MCGFLPRGMLFMGFLGDFIGHRRALLLTKALVVLGAFLWHPEVQEVARNFHPGGSLGDLPSDDLLTWYSPNSHVPAIFWMRKPTVPRCILLPAEASHDFWTHLALWRFIIGVGAGSESGT